MKTLISLLLLSVGVAQAASRPAGDFDFELAPRAIEEICLKLEAGQVFVWRFESDAALDFNLHWHQGRDVHFAEQRAAVRRGQGEWAAPQPDTYCLMWTAPAASKVKLKGWAGVR